MISAALTFLLLMISTTMGCVIHVRKRTQQLSLPDRLDILDDILTKHLNAPNTSVHKHTDPSEQHGVEGHIGERHITWSYQPLNQSHASSRDLVEHSSLPYALATLTLNHSSPANTTFQWRFPTTGHIAQAGQLKPRRLFDDPFDDLFQCRGAIDDILAAVDHTQRQHMIEATQHIERANFSDGALSITFQLYINTTEAHVLEQLDAWIELHDRWTRQAHVPRRLVDALRQEPNITISQRLLKALLRHHADSAACEDATTWLLHQSIAPLHVTLAKLRPSALEHYPELLALLRQHAADAALDVDTRKQSLSILFRQIDTHPNIALLLANLSLQAKSMDLRTAAVSYAIRMPTHPDVDRATLILSARHLVKQRAIGTEALQRLKTQLKYQRAHTTHRTHITLAKKHIEHSVRYASLIALEAKHLHHFNTLACLLHCAVFDPQRVNRQLCAAILQRQRDAWYTDLDDITRTAHPTLLRMMAALITQAPYDFSALEDSTTQTQAKLHILEHLQHTPHPDLNHHELFNEWMHQPTQDLCLRHCTHPDHLHLYWDLLRQSVMSSETSAYALLDHLDRQRDLYHNDTRVDAQRLAITVLQLHHNIALKQRALRTLAPIATKEAIAPLTGTLTILEHKHPFAHKRTTAVQHCMRDIFTLLHQLNARSQSMTGALSISNQQDANGALSISDVKGALAIAHPSLVDVDQK